MSDWGAMHSTVPTAKNGLDLEMPGGSDNYLGAPLLKAVQDGEVPVSDIDDMVTRILSNLKGTDLPNFTGRPDANTPEHSKLARELAEQSMVLLKNQGILPLSKDGLKSVAVIGPNANMKFDDSGGSGSVIGPYEVTALAGLKSYLGGGVDVQVCLPAWIRRPER